MTGSRRACAPARIARIEPDSLAGRLGLRAGDTLEAINGHAVEDQIDVWFHGADDRVRLRWHTAAAPRSARTAAADKRYDEPLGIELEPFAIRRCNNACVFCFVHQLPRGLRRELYVKDEDYRLSFLHGNYITASNLDEHDLRRIVRMRLSPLYISVHATDEAVRRRLLGARTAKPILPVMRRLARAGIAMHTQIVLCPGINDGPVLQQTVSDLATLHPAVASVAIVPVGLTSHRRRLPALEPVTPEYAARFLAESHRLRRHAHEVCRSDIVFPSDEFYLVCGRKPPSYRSHPDLPQLENGVGMYHRFNAGLARLARNPPPKLPKPLKVAVITTEMSAPVIRPAVDLLNATVKGLRVAILTASNSLFGASVTVTGLVPGCDFQDTIRRNPGFDRYVIPANALRTWDARFLDDMTLDDLRARTGADIAPAGDTADDLAAAVCSPLPVARQAP